MKLIHKTTREITNGRCYPLGATYSKEGVNFALYSKFAEQVYLLLFDDPYSDPTDIIEIKNRTKYIWHTFISGIWPGQLYGYKVKGQHIPEKGLRFNENKLLLDPYAKAITEKCVNKNNLLFGYDPLSDMKDLSLDTRDNSKIIPKAIVVDDNFNWGGDVSPDIHLEKSIIYEAHLKGFTAHKSSYANNPGTYLGFIEKIPYLKEIGINAVEFLPLQEFYNEDFLVSKGLKNYWGYNTIGFFSPESSYSSNSYLGCQVNEFKMMVRELHKAGIEVILDVVYNHTGEGDELGPTISFKGIDNPTYYCLKGNCNEPARFYENYSGCGNSINITDPAVIRFVMDSLRYWVEKMHVDGFRFDLASILGVEEGRYQKTGSFFDAISQDPILNRVKLIAEPWHIGDYQVGNFPVDWSEWNAKFRDSVRKFAKGDAGQVRDLGWRLTGSADLYSDDGRSAYNSINFITCHDGFTLYDLVSYNQKHNEDNLQNNSDGNSDNCSWNCGNEGETDDIEIIRLRKKLAKNYFIYLLFASGTPMILAGDEFLRTQRGNNNAYCQDNSISWVDWDLVDRNKDVLDFFKNLINFTKKHTILQRRNFFLGQDTDGDLVPDIEWFGIDGGKFSWDDYENRTVCFQLDGSEEFSVVGEYLLYVIFNADFKDKTVTIPKPKNNMVWHRVIDTAENPPNDFLVEGKEIRYETLESYDVKARSSVVFITK
jgi:isoamylase